MFCSIFSYGQTTINGGDIFGTLTKANSPYYIADDVTVPADSLLIIEPGVYMDFADTVKLIVRGNIKSIGTLSNPITYTCSDSMIGWGGVVIVNNPTSDTNKFEHCFVEYTHALYRIYNWIKQPGFSSSIYSIGIQSMASSPLKVDYCTFSRVNQALDVRNGDCEINNCNFLNIQPFGSYSTANNVRVAIFLEGNIIVESCNFINCYSGVTVKEVKNGEEYNVKNCYFEGFYGEALGLSKLANVTSCLFENNRNSTVKLYDFTGKVDNCTFNGTYGESSFAGDIRFFRSCIKGVIQNCTFKNSTAISGCIGGREASSSLIYNCVFVNNRRAIGFLDIDYGRVINCNFTGNSSGIVTDEEVDVINCAFVNNARTWLHSSAVNTTYPVTSSAAEYTGSGKFSFYNCIFWNNRNYYGDLVNLTIHDGLKKQSEFYNCVLDGGTSTINDRFDSTYSFSGTYQDCLEDYPQFTDTTSDDFTLTQTCSRRPYGFNKGYLQPIPIYYQGQVYADILKELSDFDGNPRIWDDTVDIGPYEAQELADRIDVDWQPMDVALCEGLSTSISGKARGKDLISIWQKSVSGGAFTNFTNPSTETILANVQKADSGDQYRLYWVNNCNDVLISDTATLHVHSPQNISLGDDFTLPRDSSAALTPGTGFEKYEWSTNDTTEILALEGMDLTNGNYTYTVEVTDSFGCISSASISITVVSGAGMKEIGEEILVYPNPASSVLFIPSVNKGVLTIYNSTGKKVLEKEIVSSYTDISELQTGMYFVTIVTDVSSYTVRLVKE